MTKKNLQIAIAVLAAAAVAGYLLWKGTAPETEFVASGIIEADDAHVGSKVGGRILRLAAREGQTVKAGDPLILLEDDETKAALAEAEGALKEAEARLAELAAGFRKEEIEQAKADWLAAKAQQENSAKLRRRNRELIQRGLIAQQEYDDAAARADAEEQKEKAARQRYDLLLAGLRKEEVDQGRARVEAARARVALLKTQLDETVVKAPFDAVVEVLDLRPGDLVTAGKPVATLLRAHDLWVRAYLPEERLGYVRPEQKLAVRVDSFPRKDFYGVVRRVHRQAEFTPRNVQTQEERVLQVFQIEVVLDDSDHLLRPGMNADVYIPYRDEGVRKKTEK